MVSERAFRYGNESWTWFGRKNTPEKLNTHLGDPCLGDLFPCRAQRILQAIVFIKPDLSGRGARTYESKWKNKVFHRRDERPTASPTTGVLQSNSCLWVIE